LQREYGDALNVLLVEVQNSDPDAIVKRQVAGKWFGTRAMWTSERPFGVTAPGIPHFALLDEEGRVVTMGLNSQLHSQMVDEIERMVKNRKKAPKDLSPAVAKATVKLRMGDFGTAYKAASKLLETPPRKNAEQVTAEATQLRNRAISRATGAVDRMKWLMENGYANVAKESIDDLHKALNGMEDLQSRCSEIAASLKSKEMAQELAASKKVAKLEKSMFADPKGKYRGAFEKLNQSFAGTKAAERAAHWAKYLPN